MMKGQKDKFLDFMEGKRKKFFIPVYQRNYNWTEENCGRLFNDLIKVEKEHLNSHFFGSVVSQYLPSGRDNERAIIDGQQRLTTVSLLLLAMSRVISQDKVKTNTEGLDQELFEDYLINKRETRADRIKLIPAKNDRNTYRKLIDNEKVDGDSRMISNYKYFYDRLLKEEIPIDDLYDAIDRLEIIHIELESGDDAQLIFESLNSTGLDLSEGDKIRNYILMNLSEEDQEEYYDRFWSQIEKNTNDHVDLFIRDYLSVKTQSIPAFKKVYSTFKNYTQQNQFETKELLTDLYRYSNFYKDLVEGSSKVKGLNAIIKRLNYLETSVTRPYFLEVLRLYEERNLSEEDVIAVFNCIESYIVRRIWCAVPTNALNKLFIGLHREIMNYDGSARDYVKKLYYCLSTKKDNVRFPSDQELKEAVRTRDVYRMNSKNKSYLLERFENQGTLEDKDVYRHIEDGTYSIEHIMPQSLTATWKEALGTDFQAIHDQWLHRLANLTLTAYNSKYSNRSFEEKKTMKNGYANSGIRMNQWIAQNVHWTDHELIERSRIFEEEAIKIWKFPQTTYVPEGKKKQSLTLKDQETIPLTGKKLARYRFQGAEVIVKSWSEMIENVVRDLYFQDPDLMMKIAKDEENGYKLNSYITDRPETLTRKSEIENGIYLELNCSTSSKCRILSRLFKAYGIDESELEFFFYEDRKSSMTYQDEIYIEFWEQALLQLRQSFPILKNVSAKNQNYVNLKVDLKSIFIEASLNRSQTKVRVYLEKENKEENKQIFDQLFLHKEELENELNTNLVWDRGNQKRSSQIGVLLEYGISDRDHWQQIIDFMDRWLKKLKVSIVEKYLKNLNI